MQSPPPKAEQSDVNECIDEETPCQTEWDSPIVSQTNTDVEKIAFDLAFTQIRDSKETDWEKRLEEYAFNLAFNEILESKEPDWVKKYEKFQETNFLY